MVFRQAFQAEVPTKLVGKLSHSLCLKAFPQSLSEKYTIHNLASGTPMRQIMSVVNKADYVR